MVRRPLAAVLAAMITGAGVLFVTAPAAHAGGSCHMPATDARATVVDMRGNWYAPTVARVDVGDSVVFRNSDEVVHTITGLGGAIGGMAEMAQGDEISLRFDAAGTYPYHCVVHPGMVGAVVVGDGVGPGQVALATEVAHAPDRSQALGAVPAAAVSTPAGSGDTPWALLGGAGALLAGATVLAARRRRRAA